MAEEMMEPREPRVEGEPSPASYAHADKALWDVLFEVQDRAEMRDRARAMAFAVGVVLFVGAWTVFGILGFLEVVR